MKIAEILARVDDEKLNQYDARVKTAWLSEVEGMVVDEILNMAEGTKQALILPSLLPAP